MTIEFSLRRRAIQARCLAIVWLSVAILILIGTYISLPFMANKTLNLIVQIERENLLTNAGTATSGHLFIFASLSLAFELVLVLFGCFLLSRSAFIEIELAARFIGLADAICIAGDDLDNLAKTVDLLVPKPKYLSIPEIVSLTDVKAIADIVKPSRGETP